MIPGIESVEPHENTVSVPSNDSVTSAGASVKMLFPSMHMAA